MHGHHKNNFCKNYIMKGLKEVKILSHHITFKT
jgi:hypothetical protein